MREVRGGDEKRLYYLCETLGVKLVGRKGLGIGADSVIASIKADRTGRKSASSSAGTKSGILKVKSGALKRKLIRRIEGPVPLNQNNNGYSNTIRPESSGNGKAFEQATIVEAMGSSTTQEESKWLGTGKQSMLRTGEALNSVSLKETMESYFNALQGFLLSRHGSTVRVGSTLSAIEYVSVKQIVDSSYRLLQSSVSVVTILFFGLFIFKSTKAKMECSILLLKNRMLNPYST